jgi:hypothetical protein
VTGPQAVRAKLELDQLGRVDAAKREMQAAFEAAGAGEHARLVAGGAANLGGTQGGPPSPLGLTIS